MLPPRPVAACYAAASPSGSVHARADVADRQDADRLARDCWTRTLAVAGLPLLWTVLFAVWLAEPRLRRAVRLRQFISVDNLPALDPHCELDRYRPARLARTWKAVLLASFNAIASAAFAYDAARHGRPTSGLAALPWAFAATALVSWPPSSLPRGLATLWSIQAFASALLLRNDSRDVAGWVGGLAALASIALAGTYPLLAVWPSIDTASVGVAPDSKSASPEDAVTLWQWLSVAHAEPMLKIGVAKDDVREVAELAAEFAAR